MGENEQPQPEPGPNLPDLPQAGPDGPPAGVDPETFRQYQEFQRFQQFQRFTQAAQGTQQAPPWTAEGGNLVPVDQPPGQPGQPGEPPPVHEQLAGMREQLDQITKSQEKVERVTNPPIWRKILRSTPVRWLIGIILIILLAVWGVPLLVQHYFGNHNQGGGSNNALPLPKGQGGTLSSGPHQTVYDVYYFIAARDAKDGCFLFSPSAANAFAHAFHTASCPAAFAAVFPQVSDAHAWADPDLSNLPNQSGPKMTISSCDFTVTGGPRLGTFTVQQQPDQTWEITGYAAQLPCASTSPSGSATTTPTEPTIPTEAPIPTGSFSGIPTG